MGQTHVHKHLRPLSERSEIDPSFLVTHRMLLAGAAEGYATSLGEQDRCIKIVLSP
jgi:threonine dehydrogenase-like Zn-dependent dehydrogenase